VESRRGRPRMHAAHSGVLDREGNAPPKSKSSPSTGVLPATHALAPHSLGVPTSWAWPSTVVRLCVVKPGRAECISKCPMGRMKPDGLQCRIGLQGSPTALLRWDGDGRGTLLPSRVLFMVLLLCAAPARSSTLFTNDDLSLFCQIRYCIPRDSSSPQNSSILM